MTQNYDFKFPLAPSADQQTTLEHQRDIVRQTYNHALHCFNQIPDDAGTLTQRVRKVRDELPDLKDWWEELTDVNSKVLQTAVERIKHNVNALRELKKKGYNVGRLKWKNLREFRWFTFNQSGFELNKKSGHLWLSKIGHIPINQHRPIPNDATIKQVTVKNERTGEWVACISIERPQPDKPPVESLSVENTVGIDLGITNFAFDSKGRAIQRLDHSKERERYEREHRNLSRKDEGSNNWEKQRQELAKAYESLVNKKEDFFHKLAGWYAREYDAVFVEDLDIKPLLERNSNARNKQEVSWGSFVEILEHHGDKHGCHVVQIPARGTTMECAQCGVETYKPIWVREHSCPACAFETDRDKNSSFVIHKRGLDELNVDFEVDELLGQGLTEVTLAETAIPVDTDDAVEVSAKRVVETGSPRREAGSPTLKERTAIAVSE